MGDDLGLLPDIEPIEIESDDDDELCEYCEKTIADCDCEDGDGEDNETDIGDGDNTRRGYTKSYVDSLNF